MMFVTWIKKMCILVLQKCMRIWLSKQGKYFSLKFHAKIIWFLQINKLLTCRTAWFFIHFSFMDTRFGAMMSVFLMPMIIWIQTLTRIRSVMAGTSRTGSMVTTRFRSSMPYWNFCTRTRPGAHLSTV